ncbi:hypothetical protein PVAP13_4NG096317 [Panicum virgatum]|uniref:Uncharacterized protein n=1 Tax=Panicum virgatum TaxID=38727 RepID=A0A8T0T1R4_PANVG|nr:hypothetical protein PVAP13_4NG096317 [Panicum virgatum]
MRGGVAAKPLYSGGGGSRPAAGRPGGSVAPLPSDRSSRAYSRSGDGGSTSDVETDGGVGGAVAQTAPPAGAGALGRQGSGVDLRRGPALPAVTAPTRAASATPMPSLPDLEQHHGILHRQPARAGSSGCRGPKWHRGYRRGRGRRQAVVSSRPAGGEEPRTEKGVWRWLRWPGGCCGGGLSGGWGLRGMGASQG